MQKRDRTDSGGKTEKKKRFAVKNVRLLVVFVLRPSLQTRRDGHVDDALYFLYLEVTTIQVHDVRRGEIDLRGRELWSIIPISSDRAYAA